MKVGALLAALAVVVVVAVAGPPRLGWYFAAWTLFGGALWLVRGVPRRRLAALVAGGGIVLAATGLSAPPSSSTDSYRYAWDGRVQAAGLSPYDHPPADPALVFVRDAWLFPPACEGRDRWPLPDGGCTRINRPSVPTIYPPVAQGYFLLIHRLSPDGVRHKALQLGGWAMAVAVLLLLCARDLRAAACWAWCPAVPIEAVNNAHVDMLAVLLVILAFTTARARGALLGAAVAAKLLPATALPGALSGVLAGGVAWRRIAAVIVPAVLVVTLAYLPYTLTSRSSVAGFLLGYLAEERYRSPADGNRYLVLRLLLPDGWAPYAAIGLLALIALHVLRYGDASRPWHGALVVTGSVLLIFTPGYSWYALLVVALAAVEGRWEWLGVALAGAIALVSGPRADHHLAAIVYTAATLTVLITWAVRRPGPSPPRKE
ncbi:glycosyltransferase 87 family protein [Nonomuraea typhae]|uniref:glycosyltransferase 87 family protein n=1 Tax=Nonomuraea typhae TaxID=2603600 RepID=UPI0012FC96D9|nr:glycosyltransferase 87 family protein [Nonomuraea typhae]